jgi:Fe-S oxidoreductase
VAYLPRYAPLAGRIGSRLPSLLAMAERAGGGWIKKSLGLAPQRAFPVFKKAFLSGAADTAAVATAADGREVLLFVDTFNNHMEPENAAAARAVLEAAGYRVLTNSVAGQRPLCCGRTFLSAGLVDEAKAEARRTLDALMPFVRRGLPVIGLEPSCLLTLRDEFLSYGYGDEARQLADAACLFEEFLLREKTAGRLELPLRALVRQKILVHGHCHQKAFDAFTPVQAVLKWIPQAQLSVVESSCCGMAGSFGYEAEHYAASLAMAELALLPALRQADTDCIVVADGTSCRHQIRDGTSREALHVARVLAMALVTPPASRP